MRKYTTKFNTAVSGPEFNPGLAIQGGRPAFGATSVECVSDSRRRMIREYNKLEMTQKEMAVT